MIIILQENNWRRWRGGGGGEDSWLNDECLLHAMSGPVLPWNMRMYHYLYRDRIMHPRVKDLQSTTRLAKSWTLQIVLQRVEFPVPVQSNGWLFISYQFSIPIAKPLFIISKTTGTSKHFLVRKRPQLKLILTSCHCMIYDLTRCSLKRSCLSPSR